MASGDACDGHQRAAKASQASQSSARETEKREIERGEGRREEGGEGGMEVAGWLSGSLKPSTVTAGLKQGLYPYFIRFFKKFDTQ